MQAQSRERIQNQLRHFLKEYRIHHYLSAEQAAERLGVEIATYRTLEGRKAENRVHSVLEYLEKIAALNHMSLSGFVSFLERSPRTESGSNQTKRKLYKWESDLLSKFDVVGIPLRNRFMATFTSKNKDEIKEILACLTRIASMPSSKREALFNLVKEMEPNA